MKRILALLLIALMVFSLVSCTSPENTEPQKNDYVLSTEAASETVIDGVMTDIAGNDPILERNIASWLDTCVLYEVNIRQFTEEGTFAAFEGHLDRLKDMGVNTLWLMPIHPISETGRKGTLGSYYAVSDYTDVNPEFGTKEDFQHLVNTAHSKGFKIILDWVANHTGWDNAWIKEHDDWYVHKADGSIESPYDWTDVAQLDYDNYEMRAEMIKCMQYWVEEVGIDGFRCDHAIGVPARFWNAAVYKLKSINRDIMMLAETSATEGLTTYAFDCCYNDALYGQSLMIKGGIATNEISDKMPVEARYVNGSFPMNYLDNHDKNSYEGSIVSRYRESYEPLLALTFLTPGLPLIYTSDEEGYDHEIEFFEKDPVKWTDHPKYAPMITKLSKLKTENKALLSFNTDIEFIETSNPNALAFSRTGEDGTILYIANLYYEEIKDVNASFDFDKATCVMHYDGTTIDTEDHEITAQEFEKKDYQPYEFYVLVVSNS
ncbi:MAG: hypothetical protein IJJ15_07990 [Ruminococcus sp.]|nr:hypothetical protein [Ruminococcus sp.]